MRKELRNSCSLEARSHAPFGGSSCFSFAVRFAVRSERVEVGEKRERVREQV